MEVVRKPDALKDSRLVQVSALRLHFSPELNDCQNFLTRMEENMLRHRMWASLSQTDKLVWLEVRYA